MTATLAFDVYGTLIDTHGLVSVLQGMVGESAQAFSQVWRDKQLEYSFRRGLMKKYVDFGVCTRQALDYTCMLFAYDLSDAQKRDLLERYRLLPAFDDVRDGLDGLRSDGFRLYAFSNGSRTAVAGLLDAAKIDDCFIDIVSVEDVSSFKPNPDVYQYFLQRSAAPAADAWLVSSNPFDVIGAVSAGMRAAWLQRSPGAIFDPWEFEPTVKVSSLSSLGREIERFHTGA